MYIMNHETISYKALIQELSVQSSHMPPLHKLCNPNSHNESNESFAHAHKHIQCMCEQLTTDSQLSLSPVISTGVHWNDMHVVNRGKSLVACEFN